MKKNEFEETGPRPGEDVTDVAEATAEALHAIREILIFLRRDAHLTEKERGEFDRHLAKIEEIAEWADPEGKHLKSSTLT